MKRNQKKKSFPLLPVILGMAALAIVFIAGGFTFAASQEEHDAFCASCHTQPESTFYQRSTESLPSDLASYHTTENTRCIDCHSGPGIFGRVQAEFMGARNATKWYSGTAIQPAVLTFAISDQNCLKCHQEITQRDYVAKTKIQASGSNLRRFEQEGEFEGGNGHWHLFLSRWQRVSKTAGTCVSCHSGHATGGTAEQGFMQDEDVRSTCNACHRVLGDD